VFLVVGSDDMVVAAMDWRHGVENLPDRCMEEMVVIADGDVDFPCIHDEVESSADVKSRVEVEELSCDSDESTDC
jgi:hypothetical protein